MFPNHALFSFLLLSSPLFSAACSKGFRECASETSTNADDGFVLYKLDASTGGLCLDGTPGGFYYRPGQGADASKFIVENEGGGWCTSTDDCFGRTHSPLGSSRSWPARGCPSMDGGSNAMLSNNCTINPFCNYTMVHLNYCDGASFSGSVTDPVPVPSQPAGTHIYYRGRAILDASVEKLMSMGMRTATEVIWKGCSAGGLSVILHADYIHSLISPSTRFVAMPDAGFFMDLPTWDGQEVYTPLYQWVAANHNVSNNVNSACVEHYRATNDTWRCFMAQYTLPFITSDLYMTQDLADKWQLINIAQLPTNCTHWPLASTCTPAQIAYVHRFRYQMLAALEPLFLAAPRNGGFLTTCLNHCHQNIVAKWTLEKVSGQTLVESFPAWYHGNTSVLQPLVIGDELGLNPSCVYGY